MAIIAEIVDPVGMEKWISERPPVVQELARKYPPNILYRLSDQSRVYVVGYNEDGTLIVAVTGRFNLVAFERQVHGVKPEDLVECDLPDPDEILGVQLNDAEADQLVSKLRAEHLANEALRN